MVSAKIIKRSNRFRLVSLICVTGGGILFLVGVVLYIVAALKSEMEIQKNNYVVGVLMENISDVDTVYSSDEDVAVVDNNKYIGIIEIPSINLTLPVLFSCEDGNLDKGACLYYRRGSNYVIGGHNRISQFRSLYDMKVGDVLYFYDLYSNKKEYTLVEAGIFSPNDTHEFINRKYNMTLFTCYWGDSERYVLRFI